ncbi:NAD-dependent epimerase/dehydratase family protein [Neobacillus sp. DY30]|uniref:NAD-dependent epimerase/dehydratase family protein n=1 Tax=Neobacillus sp. DY30 TaxID=3047871 RepID=UPI0024C095EC|nr:NAD-dependent epimerase/dehydratase family protein [Neobacillus sp. DY30]WHX98458.1 NAD-dependent epimerase/dehydratase family protein [Neobacillus sp. DY30]
MSVVLITGSAGLIGSEAVEFFANLGYEIVGIDNNMRQYFFGIDGDTEWNSELLSKKFKKQYTHYSIDIRNSDKINQVFEKYSNDIKLIVHTAAQPSHDWAAKEPQLDFGINANGTLNLLEAMRHNCPNSVFVFMSTNKVYGDQPNRLPLLEQETRWEIDHTHSFENGIPETMDIDQCMHSLFGASKLAADILVQEYGKYFKLQTTCLRGGVLTGSKQSGAQLHGFLNYLMKCIMTGTPYKIFGYKGKQVRDIIHSKDVVSAINSIFENPRIGEVYNLGGGRQSNVSVLEAIELGQIITQKKLKYQYVDQNRMGDHIWYISDISKFKSHYPDWKLTYQVKEILEEIFEENKDRWLNA